MAIKYVLNPITGKLDAVSEETPASPDTSVQFNDGGVFGGDDELKWDKTINQLQVGLPTNVTGYGPGNKVTIGGDEVDTVALNVQNLNSTSETAYADIYTSADNDGIDETGHYTDFGICNSGFIGDEFNTALEAGKGYMYNSGGGMLITTDGSAAKPLQFGTNGFAKTNIHKIIDSDGNMQIAHDDRYLNFGEPLDPTYDFADGEAGYGFRVNAGNVEFKHKDKQWAIIPYLAIETTTDNFFNNLIANSLLEPQATYCLTDYQNETPIANTSPIEYTVGAVEQIYLVATSTNTFQAQGVSKTYPDEKVIVNQNVPSIINTSEEISYDSGTNYGTVTVDAIGATELTLSANHIDTATVCNFNFQGYTSQKSFNFTLADKGTKWDYNPTTSKFEYITGAIAYSEMYSLTGELFDITVTSPTTFTCSADYINDIVTNTEMYFYDNINYTEANCTFDNRGTTWEYDVLTHTFTLLIVPADFSFENDLTITFYLYYSAPSFDFTDDGTDFYLNASINYIEKTFPYGRIVTRKNERLNSYIEADYRSQVFRRYKILSTAWAGNGIVGTVYLSSGNLYFCIKNTIIAPSGSAVDWIPLGADNYLMSDTDMIFQEGTPVHNLSYDSANYFDFPMFNISEFDALDSPIDLKIMAPVANEFADIVFLGAVNQIRQCYITANDATIYGSLFRQNTLDLTNVVLSGNYNYEINSGVITSVFCGKDFRNNTIGSLSNCLLESFIENNVTQMKRCVCRSYFQKNAVQFLDYVRFFGYTSLNTIQSLVYSDFTWTGTTENSACCSKNYFANTGYSQALLNSFRGSTTNNKFYSASFYENIFYAMSYCEFYYSTSYNYFTNTASSPYVGNCKFYGFMQFNKGEISLANSTVYGVCSYNKYYPQSLSYQKIGVANGGTGYTLNDTLLLTTGLVTPAWTSGTYKEGQYVTTTSGVSTWVTGTYYTYGRFIINSGTSYYCLVSHTAGTFATDLASQYWIASTPTYLCLRDHTTTVFSNNLNYWIEQTPSTVQATTVAGGVVTAITLLNGGSYIPMGTLATTGGTGSGCVITTSKTFSFNVSNGGSGYSVGNVLSLVPPETPTAWTTSYSYVVGNYVTESGNTYRCQVEHTASATIATDIALGYWKEWISPALTVVTLSGSAVANYLTVTSPGKGLEFTGTFATTVTPAGGNGCTISSTHYVNRFNVTTGVFYGDFSTNYFYTGSLANNTHLSIFSGNTFYTTNYGNNFQYNLTFSVQNCVFFGSTFSGNIINQKCYYLTIEKNAGISDSTVVGYLQYLTIATGRSISASTLNSIYGNGDGARLTLDANITSSTLSDVLFGNTITISTAISSKFYNKTNNFLLGGQAAKDMTMERHLTTNTAGNNLTFVAGGATVGATDKTGGNLILKSGIATGSGSSDIILSTVTAGASGTTDRVATEKVRIKGDGSVGFGTNNPTEKVHVVGNILSTEYISGKKSGVFAYLSTPANTTIATAGTYQYIVGTFTNTVLENFTLLGTPAIRYDGTLTQYFEVDWHATFSADVANTTVSIAIFKNGSLVGGSTMSQFCKNANELYTSSGTCVVSLAQNDTIQLVITSDGTGDVITMNQFTTTINEFFD